MKLPPGLDVGLYGRKSHKDDDGDEAASILVQYERGEQWSAREGHTVAKKWADNISAWSGQERPKFLQALAALERGDIDILWVYGSDRFTRQGARKILDIMDRPLGTRPKIFFDYESLCTWEEAHRLPLVVKAEIDKGFADRLSKNIRDTKTRQRARGEWATKPPYGTRRSADHPRQLEPDPETWPVIVRIYELSARRWSIRGIAAALNADGIPASSGGAWRNAMVRIILNNPVYEGWMYTKVRGMPVLYLDPDGKPVRVFAPDASVLGHTLVTNARSVVRGPKYSAKDGSSGYFAPLRGVLYCAGCGSRMSQSGGPKNRHYRCGRHAAKVHCPAPATTHAGPIENFVRTTWANIVDGLEVGDEQDHAELAAMGARWFEETTPIAETQAVREAVALARKRLERLRADRDLGLWDDDLTGFSERVRAAQAALRGAESVAVPDVRLPNFAGLDFGELVGLVADDVPAETRWALYTSVIDAVVVAPAGGPGERWRDSRVIAVVPVSPAPRTVD